MPRINQWHQPEADLDMEWRQIPNEHYSINTKKQVKNDNTNLLLKPFKMGKRGALAVDIRGKQRTIHSLFELAFPEHCSNLEDMSKKSNQSRRSKMYKAFAKHGLLKSGSIS